MLRRKPKFNHPERRKHIRILTIRNFAAFLAVVVFAVVAVNVISELRAPHGSDFGRLFSQQDPDEITPKPAPQVVHEAPVPDIERADPTLLAPMARSQYLGDPQLTPKVTAAQTIQPAQPASDPAKVEIVGGANGVNIVHAPSVATPKLTGGIFKN